jgi:hypothetical protein
MIFTISVFYFFWIVFDCKPIRYFWQQVKAPTSGSCKAAAAFADATYAHASVLIAADAVLTIIPLFVVHYLHAGWWVKISVAAILTIGSLYAIFVPPNASYPSPSLQSKKLPVTNMEPHDLCRSSCVATIVRLTLVHQMLAAGSFLTVTTKLVLWAIVEVATSIVAVSATALRPLWEILRVIPRYTFGSRWGIVSRWYGSERGTQLHDLAPARTTSSDHILESYNMSQDSEGSRFTAPKRTGFDGCP